MRKNIPAILIIEDDFINRKLLTEILRIFNVEISEAENGILGIEAANKICPDLILLDINMPKMDGFEAISILRQNPDLKNTKIIACTALSSTITNDSIKQLFDDKIQKPYTIDAIANTIRKHLPSID